MERLTAHTAKGLKFKKGRKFVELLSDKEMTLKALNHLAELEDKLEDGQALELPFKVGDRVFLVRRNRNNALVVSRTKIEMYLYHSRLLVKCSCDSSWHEPQNVFSDKTQAEARLKEIKERGE